MAEYKDDIALLESLLNNSAWNMYIKLLNRKFDSEYKKLRNSKRNDVSYGKLCGMLDGLEYAMNIIDRTIKEFQLDNSNK